MFEEKGPDACLCPKNIAAIREARLKQLSRGFNRARPAPAGLPDDLREDWNDKAALKAGPRVCAPKVLSDPVGHIDTPSQSNKPIVLSLPPGLPEAEPAAGHQAVPAARAAGAGCQPAAGAGCQPVDPAPVAAGTRPDPKAPPSLFGRSAAAPSGAADAAGSVEFLNLDDGRAGAGTDAGRPGHDAILDGMQALRDGMGALEAALTVMAPTMATKDDMVALKTAMETGFDEMSKRLDDMEEKVQSLQHGWNVVPEGAAEGAAEDHEGEASGPVCAHSMDAEEGGAQDHGGPIVDNWICDECDFGTHSLQILNSHRARVHGWFGFRYIPLSEGV